MNPEPRFLLPVCNHNDDNNTDGDHDYHDYHDYHDDQLLQALYDGEAVRRFVHQSVLHLP